MVLLHIKFCYTYISEIIALIFFYIKGPFLLFIFMISFEGEEVPSLVYLKTCAIIWLILYIIYRYIIWPGDCWEMLTCNQFIDNRQTLENWDQKRSRMTRHLSSRERINEKLFFKILNVIPV